MSSFDAREKSLEFLEENTRYEEGSDDHGIYDNTNLDYDDTANLMTSFIDKLVETGLLTESGGTAAQAIMEADALLKRAEPDGSMLGWSLWWDDLRAWREKFVLKEGG